MASREEEEPEIFGLKIRRVEWGKVGRFFRNFFNRFKNKAEMKNFMDDCGQCVSSLHPQVKIAHLKSHTGGQPPLFF